MKINIQCIICQTMIPMDPDLLVQGKAFTCPKCAAQIALSVESIPVASAALEKFNKLNAGTKN
ncbi:MAG: hypothetical protein PVH61_04630 [Candidatus Aminicenantes bacterium]|jgi:hypothetical protein